ncbi:unnamed protein product [Zymoseptoria tritici ST99CH_1A5]|uniref:Histone-lysine N-methyltransferase, H3 lysine-36 specific n=1 Tax=Zymoseptoria tritici ST99CH_1A5 TaxID=1276529 RepID=A0A1Y6LBV4_ZYMTR|nr:unnamed protein product [Zymoseptoria tritici ST99CH_3D1]SMY21977.1 unnamed protein product [Zymoseptoria tritici ST99CH_1A5]
MATSDATAPRLESEVRDMHLKEEDADMEADSDAAPASVKEEETSVPASVLSSRTGTPANYSKRASRSGSKLQSAADSPAVKSDEEEIVGGEIVVKAEPRGLKLSRSTSHKIEKRAPQMYHEYEDKTKEATSTFELLSECTYANKYLGTTEHALECDCSEEWDAPSRSNHACGEDSDCINRATKMECVADCNCGSKCQNMRFQRKKYANVDVIKTEKKGYGLRTQTDLRPNDFIFEYIGEVIGENVFRRRMQQYDEDGIKHFYFMSLTKGEFVDATKRGNLGRFCNHSCNPNCYVDKWVVGDKLRMGIFAERAIQAGEELVFNYNVDRYGAEPQPCYCGEANCTGYIGGKTQTERATKLPNSIIEALGIDDADAWDTAVAKRPRKKKAGEDDEEYVNNVEPRGLDEEGVNKVMSSLMQCKEKWIAVKLLTRIQRADDEKVRNRVVRFHGYRILKTALTNFADDVNVCLQIIDILEKMPRLTRNKIQDSKIEEAVETLVTNEDEGVSSRAKTLLAAWGKLEIAYRIPRMKRDPNAVVHDRKLDRLDRPERRKSRSVSKSPERIVAPTGPRNAPQRPNNFFGNARPPPRFRPPPPGALPPGWFEAQAGPGQTYYYTQNGTTTWQRPTIPASAAPPPPPPKAISQQQVLDDLIKNIVATQKEVAPKPASAAATPMITPKKERKEDKWRSLPEEKQKKLYEGTLSPHIMHVVAKYKHKLPKDELKRWAKEFAKQVVDSDFRKNKVADPNKIDDKKIKDVRKHAQTFFEKAVKKKQAAEAKRAGKDTSKDIGGNSAEDSPAAPGSPMLVEDNDDDDADQGREQDVAMSVDAIDAIDATPATPTAAALKRLRGDESMTDADNAFSKKQRTESVEAFAPPPPPPPPPAGDDAMLDDHDPHYGGPSVVFHPAVNGAAEHGFSIKGAATGSRPSSRNGEPNQIATPPTTGSPDHEVSAKGPKMNPERLAMLGLSADQ